MILYRFTETASSGYTKSKVWKIIKNKENKRKKSNSKKEYFKRKRKSTLSTKK